MKEHMSERGVKGNDLDTLRWKKGLVCPRINLIYLFHIYKALREILKTQGVMQPLQIHHS